MKKQIKHREEAFQRGIRFFAENPLTPANARATEVLSVLQTVVSDMQTALSRQIVGRGESLGGAADRLRLAGELRQSVSEISGTASVLDPAQYPGAEEQFRLPASQSYDALLGTARGFATAIGPVKAAFVERGLLADFDEKLVEQVGTFEAATNRKWDGRQTQMGGTASLETLWRRGMAAMNELDKILTNRLRTSNPELLALWKAVKRQERMPQRKKGQPAAAPASIALASVLTAERVLSTPSPVEKEEEGAGHRDPALNGSMAA